MAVYEECGTWRGYQKHKEREGSGKAACSPCREAWRIYCRSTRHPMRPCKICGAGTRSKEDLCRECKPTHHVYKNTVCPGCKGRKRPQSTICLGCTRRIEALPKPLTHRCKWVGCLRRFRPGNLADPGIYCSRSCAAKGKGTLIGPKQPETLKAPELVLIQQFACIECGQISETGRSVCSSECRRRRGIRASIAYYQEHKDEPRFKDARRKRAQHRRAAMVSAESEDFTHEEIFERDGWICQDCGEPTNREAVDRRKDPLAPVLDHIIPLAKHGTHTRDNVQCLHMVCNARKGASVAKDAA